MRARLAATRPASCRHQPRLAATRPASCRRGLARKTAHGPHLALSPTRLPLLPHATPPPLSSPPCSAPPRPWPMPRAFHSAPTKPSRLTPPPDPALPSPPHAAASFCPTGRATPRWRTRRSATSATPSPRWSRASCPSSRSSESASATSCSGVPPARAPARPAPRTPARWRRRVRCYLSPACRRDHVQAPLWQPRPEPARRQPALQALLHHAAKPRARASKRARRARGVASTTRSATLPP